MSLTTLATRGLNIPAYDYISNTYSFGYLIQTVYKKGGASGVVVATLDMTYDVDGNLETLTKTE